jgi:MSHA pilin protein MshD
MPTNHWRPTGVSSIRSGSSPIKSVACAIESGVSLIEMVVFLVVVATASTALFKVYNFSLVHQADPIIQVRATEFAQAKLDEILALKYDESTPTGGIPACSNGGISPGSTGGAPLTTPAIPCTNGGAGDTNMNDVDDYHGFADTPATGYSRTVTVVTSGNTKLITVKVNAPKNYTLTLAAYRANF